MKKVVKNLDEMLAFGEEIGRKLNGGEVIELVGDLGAGKTTLTKGIAKGLKISDEIQSPSFTILRNYEARDNLQLNHYDFYRLDDPGIMKQEIMESLASSKNITVIEWANSVSDILPENRIIIKISYLPNSDGREVEIK